MRKTRTSQSITGTAEDATEYCNADYDLLPVLSSKEAAMVPALKACATALALTLLASAASAQDTVRIGNETKRAFGTVTALSAGDVACYVTLRDDRGVPFEEMALFEICEQPTLVGKRVALTYALQNVMAPECQGDPSCRKSRTVPVINAARPLN
jgi:hypothetical protein